MEGKELRPYHVFTWQDDWFVINVSKMTSILVDHDSAQVLQQIDQKKPVPAENQELLQRLGLLMEKKTANSRRDVKLDTIPVSNLCLFTTQSCNLRCVYCYGDGGGYGGSGHMEEATAFQAVDWMISQLGKVKKMHIGFFGGEPFLNFPLIKAVVEYAKKKAAEADKDIAFHGTTNGTLLSDEVIEFVEKHQLNLMVSFDGTKEIHDRQRPYASGEGSYDDIVANLEKLLAVMPDTPGHAVIHGDEDPEKIKEAMKKVGFRSVTVMPASQSLFAERVKEPRCLEQMVQAIEKEGLEWQQHIETRELDALKNLRKRSGLYMTLLAMLHNSKRYFACGAGLGLAAVAINGDIYLCHRFVGQTEYKVGNVFDLQLDREKYQQSPVMEGGICEACFAKYYCAGGCKHDNAGVNENVFSPAEDICRLRRREMEVAAAVAASLTEGDREFLRQQEVFPPKPCPLDF